MSLGVLAMTTDTADGVTGSTFRGDDFASCYTFLNSLFDWHAVPVSAADAFSWKLSLAGLRGPEGAPGKMTLAHFRSDGGFRQTRLANDCDIAILLPMKGWAVLHYPNESVTIQPGQAAIYQSLAVQKLETFAQDGAFETGFIKLSFIFAQQFLSETLHHPVERNLNLPPLIEAASGKNELILSIITLLCNQNFPDISRSISPGLRRRIFETFSQLLMELIPHRYSPRLREQQAAPVPRHIRLAQKYLEQHVMDQPSIADVARAAQVSVRTLEVNFRAYLDMTPRTYLRVVRLRLARHALMSTNDTRQIADIAKSLGFTHVSRFSQYYASLFGETPSDTRQRVDR